MLSGRKAYRKSNTTFLDTIATRFDQTQSNFLLANAKYARKQYPIVYCSDGFCELVGMKRTNLMLKSSQCRFLYGPETDKRKLKLISNALSSAKEEQLFITLYKNTGEKFYCLWDIIPIPNDNDDVSLILCSFKEVCDLIDGEDIDQRNKIPILTTINSIHRNNFESSTNELTSIICTSPNEHSCSSLVWSNNTLLPSIISPNNSTTFPYESNQLHNGSLRNNRCSANNRAQTASLPLSTNLPTYSAVVNHRRYYTMNTNMRKLSSIRNTRSNGTTDIKNDLDNKLHQRRRSRAVLYSLSDEYELKKHHTHSIPRNNIKKMSIHSIKPKRNNSLISHDIALLPSSSKLRNQINEDHIHQQSNNLMDRNMKRKILDRFQFLKIFPQQQQPQHQQQQLLSQKRIRKNNLISQFSTLFRRDHHMIKSEKLISSDIESNNRTQKIPLKNGNGLCTSHIKRKTSVTSVTASKYLIRQHETFKKFWDAILIIATIYVSIIVPLDAAFMNTKTFLYPIDLISESLFICDVFINFFTTYVNKTGEIVTSHRLIALRYLKSWFFIDTIAAIPLDIFYYVCGNLTVQVARILKLLRLVRLAHFYQLLDTGAMLGWPMLVALVGVVLMLAHWLACIWCVIGTQEISYRTNNLFYETAWINTLKSKLSFSSKNMTTVPVETKYITALYFTCSSLTSVGYGNISANTNKEQIFAIIAMILGALLNAIVFGNITAIIQQLYSRRTAFHSRIRDLHDFWEIHHLPKELQQKMHDILENTWNNNRGIDPDNILKDFPRDLQNEIQMHLNKEFLALPIFREASVGCLKSLAKHVMQMICLPDNYLLHAGDPIEQFYYILNGSLEVIRDNQIIAILGKGDILGTDIDEYMQFSLCPSLVETPKASGDVRPITYCEMNCLNLKGLLEVSNVYPEFGEDFAREIHNELSFNLREGCDVYEHDIEQQETPKLMKKEENNIIESKKLNIINEDNEDEEMDKKFSGTNDNIRENSNLYRSSMIKSETEISIEKKCPISLPLTQSLPISMRNLIENNGYVVNNRKMSQNSNNLTNNLMSTISLMPAGSNDTFSMSGAYSINEDGDSMNHMNNGSALTSGRTSPLFTTNANWKFQKNSPSNNVKNRNQLEIPKKQPTASTKQKRKRLNEKSTNYSDDNSTDISCTSTLSRNVHKIDNIQSPNAYTRNWFSKKRKRAATIGPLIECKKLPFKKNRSHSLTYCLCGNTTTPLTNSSLSWSNQIDFKLNSKKSNLSSDNDTGNCSIGTGTSFILNPPSSQCQLNKDDKITYRRPNGILCPLPLIKVHHPSFDSESALMNLTEEHKSTKKSDSSQSFNGSDSVCLSDHDYFSDCVPITNPSSNDNKKVTEVVSDNEALLGDLQKRSKNLNSTNRIHNGNTSLSSNAITSEMSTSKSSQLQKLRSTVMSAVVFSRTKNVKKQHTINHTNHHPQNNHQNNTNNTNISSRKDEMKRSSFKLKDRNMKPKGLKLERKYSNSVNLLDRKKTYHNDKMNETNNDYSMTDCTSPRRFSEQIISNQMKQQLVKSFASRYSVQNPNSINQNKDSSSPSSDGRNSLPTSNLDETSKIINRSCCNFNAKVNTLNCNGNTLATSSTSSNTSNNGVGLRKRSPFQNQDKLLMQAIAATVYQAISDHFQGNTLVTQPPPPTNDKRETHPSQLIEEQMNNNTKRIEEISNKLERMIKHLNVP
ncbi:hypothetical protein SNEBB_003900 [Seison nebaliae]|nr:hypothetical protein SNEBB_003900 [Seison nebaliae]